MGSRSARCVSTSKAAAKVPLSSMARAGSATPRISLWGRRFRSRRDHSFIASQKTVLYFMPRLPTPNPMGGQGVSSCATTSSADKNCAVKEKKKRSRSTRLIIYWLWMISAVPARFDSATKRACFARAGGRAPDRAAPHRAWTFAQRVTRFRGEQRDGSGPGIFARPRHIAWRYAPEMHSH